MWKSRILFLLVLAAAFLLAVGYEDKNVGFTLLYALLLLFVFALVTVLSAPLLIRIQEQIQPEAIVKNEEVRYTLSVKNRGLFFYPRVSCVFYSADSVHYGDAGTSINTIVPRGCVTKEFVLCFPYRGVYKLGVRQVIVTDFLGLFCKVITAPKPAAVTVYPQDDDSFALSIRNEPQNSSLNNDLFNEDYTSIADVRKYTSSDSLRKIHWQLSAKRGELIVKNYQSFEPDRTILFLDTKALPLQGSNRAAFEDKMVSYAASAIAYCARGRLPSDFIYGDAEFDRMAIDQLDEIGEVYGMLAAIRFEGAASTFSTMEHVAGPYNLVVLLADIDDAVHEELRSSISFDHNVILYYFYSALVPLTDDKLYLLESLKSYGAGVNKVEI